MRCARQERYSRRRNRRRAVVSFTRPHYSTPTSTICSRKSDERAGASLDTASSGIGSLYGLLGVDSSEAAKPGRRWQRPCPRMLPRMTGGSAKATFCSIHPCDRVLAFTLSPAVTPNSAAFLAGVAAPPASLSAPVAALSGKLAASAGHHFAQFDPDHSELLGNI